jgi:NACHT domain
VAWADGQDERCIFWLSGLAGTGKSTIARTIARKYYEEERLGASFFFSRGGGDASHAGKFFTSIAVHLASKSPSIKRYISQVIAEHSDIASQSLHDQWRQLVLRPLSKLNSSFHQYSLVLVVDALDECEGEDDIRIIVQLLAEVRSLRNVRLRVFMTSRPEIPIRHGFNQIPVAGHQDFVLHNIAPSIIDHDISIFLEYNLGIIGQERGLAANWPGEQTINRLVQRANGLFIWAATACRFIREGRKFASKRLSLILQGDSSITAPEKQLNEIYVTVLKNSVRHNYDEQETEDLCTMLRTILGSIVVLFSPLSANSLTNLLHLPKEDVDQSLEDLHSILEIPDEQARPIRLHHPSFRDFLLDKDRCGDPRFGVNENQAHRTLADACMRLMSTTLKRDICGLNRPGALTSDVEGSRVEQFIPLGVQYACIYWVQHLEQSGAQLYDDDQVHRFLRKHLLHWLEALSLIGKMSEGVLAIISLESYIPVSLT